MAVQAHKVPGHLPSVSRRPSGTSVRNALRSGERMISRGRTRTGDLRIMNPMSFQLLYPAISAAGRSRTGISESIDPASCHGSLSHDGFGPTPRSAGLSRLSPPPRLQSVTKLGFGGIEPPDSRFAMASLFTPDHRSAHHSSFTRYYDGSDSNRLAGGAVIWHAQSSGTVLTRSLCVLPLRFSHAAVAPRQSEVA